MRSFHRWNLKGNRVAALFMATVLCFWISPGKSGAALNPEALTLGGEVRERYEFRGNADFNDSVKDTLSFVGSRIRLQAGYEVSPDIAFFFQVQDSRTWGSETSTASNEKNLDLHQGVLTLRNLFGPPVVVVGRQELVFGDSRLVGNFGWSNVGRSFDGARLTLPVGPTRVDLWAAVVKKYGTNLGADPALSPTHQDGQQFYGIYASTKKGAFTLEPYLLYLKDTGNPRETDSTGALVSPVTAPAAQGQDRWTIGFRGDGKGMNDRIDLTGEAAWQTGTMDARGTIPESDISAYALSAKAGFTFSGSFKPRIGIEYDRASGDDDSTDDKIGTFENLFPTNHIHYGYMDYVGWRNMQDLRISLSAKPAKSSGVSLDLHLFSLAEKTDHWYRASGIVYRTTPSGNAETDLGREIDLVAYTLIKEKVRLEGGYGHFFPGDYVEANFPAAMDDSDFFYLQAGMNF